MNRKVAKSWAYKIANDLLYYEFCSGKVYSLIEAMFPKLKDQEKVKGEFFELLKKTSKTSVKPYTPYWTDNPSPGKE